MQLQNTDSVGAVNPVGRQLQTRGEILCETDVDIRYEKFSFEYFSCFSDFFCV